MKVQILPEYRQLDRYVIRVIVDGSFKEQSSAMTWTLRKELDRLFEQYREQGAEQIEVGEIPPANDLRD